jgi:hypothetical protein
MMSKDQAMEQWRVDGERLRDEGIARAVQHADQEYSTWSARAYNALKRYVNEHRGKSFAMEDVRLWAESTGIIEAPPDPRAWGGIAQKAFRSGLISKNGYRPHRNPSRHRAPSSVWISHGSASRQPRTDF